MTTVMYAIARIAIVVTFIASGVLRLTDISGTGDILASRMGPLPELLAVRAASIEAIAGLPFPQVLVIAGAAFEIAAGLLIATGIFTRWSSLGLLAFTGINIYYFHNVWELGSAELMPALNKLSIMGGLLIVAAVGRPKAPAAGADLGRMPEREIPGSP